MQQKVGEIDAEGPPVPIPNTEVKLCRAENTWLETAREDRYSPTRTSEVRLSSDLVLFLPSLPVHVQTDHRHRTAGTCADQVSI